MKKREKKSGHRIALSVLSSVILTIIIVSLVNVGLSIFVDNPNYNDYCPSIVPKDIDTQSGCEIVGGEWQNNLEQSENQSEGFCDVNFSCNKEYKEAQKAYNQVRYYVFAIIGLILLLIGMYSAMHTLQYMGLGSGGILLLEGIVTNLENKVLVFVSLLIILTIFGFLVFKKIEKK